MGIWGNLTRWSKWGWIVAVVAGAIIVGFLTWLVAGSVAARGVPIWTILLTVLVGVAFGFADWYARGRFKTGEGWRALKSRRWLAQLGMSIFFGLGAGLFVQQFIRPTEFDILKAGQAKADRKLDTVIAQTAPKPWRAFDNLDGLWGEELGGCKVVYRFERRDHGLIVTLVRKEPDMADYRMTASLHPGGQGDVARATLKSSTASDETTGQTLVFTYANDGVTERLDWLNENRSNAGALKLEPCGDPR